MEPPKIQAPRNDTRESENLAWVVRLFAQARTQGFFGKLTFHFKNGSPYHVVEERSLQPPNTWDEFSS